MALPLLAKLSIRARTAYPTIQRGVREGLSSRALSDVLKDAGLGLRRSTLLTIMRAERQLVEHGRNMRFLPFNRAPNPDKLPESITRTLRTYSYQIELRGRVIDTQEIITRHVTVSSSTLLTRGEAETIALENARNDIRSYPLEIDKAQLTNVTKSGVLGTLL